MDKYIVKVPRCDSHATSSDRRMKQATITSLKRVVTTDEIASIKEKLCVKDQNETVLLECLEILSKKIPSRKIIIESKIGRIVKRLRCHKDTKVRQLAQRVCKEWNNFFKTQNNLVPVEVKYDLVTTKKRETVKKFIAQSFELESNSKLVCDLESSVFSHCKKLVNNQYQKISRKLVFALKSKETQRNLLSRSITPSELVQEIAGKLPTV
ncbi:transcription elongation factor A N-terminal and central domain-containing protein 2 [Octopus sinensis]|uniref:Transcription elongation factor A N-terminal and central domain-containing protein 2 n=1 Tax=Octopus sinensis TaxID=2607531 RepID=A0A6P7SML2_9MOLL|nr:transcription elongation factor A N-terminal and central domain-containing protein 2 [Octopus sinensis]